MQIRSGREEKYPYSLSRWTDIPGSESKWAWFLNVLSQGEMFAFDPRTAFPSVWSLKPEDTLGLNFWTKDPTNLLIKRELLRPYKVKIHLTATGWEEVEKGAPSEKESKDLLMETAYTFGPENVIWRFSPVPLVPDVVTRFWRLAETARMAGLKKVYVAFLQENDRVPETRTPIERYTLLQLMAKEARIEGIEVLLCNDDHSLLDLMDPKPTNLSLGVCVGPEDWDGLPPSEGCGCALMVDPFTINESCNFGCSYCYSADQRLSPKKHNTTHLPMVR